MTVHTGRSPEVGPATPFGFVHHLRHPSGLVKVLTVQTHPGTPAPRSAAGTTGRLRAGLRYGDNPDYLPAGIPTAHTGGAELDQEQPPGGTTVTEG